MATSSYFSVLLSISVTSFLLLQLPKVHSSESVSFDFSKFRPGEENLMLQGDARITAEGQLQLTAVENGVPVSKSLGRALYSSPIHIWDSDTQAVASFLTAFTFVIRAPNKAKPAEGLAMFLAPVGTEPQKPGGYLGIFKKEKYDKEIQTVAVEFDTFHNRDWDPEHRHIGIDVNHITSMKTTAWNFSNGDVADVFVSYDGPTCSLTVSMIYPSSRTSYILDEKVDLRKYLPEWVMIGFSATSGLSEDYVETHDVLSWGFESELPDSSSGAFKKNMHLSSYLLKRMSA